MAGLGLAFDKEINGKFFTTKEGQTTNYRIHFDECFIKKDGGNFHLHLWVSEQEGIYAWAKKGTDNPKAEIPGRAYLYVPGDSKELGVQCACKVLEKLDEGVCYKGMISVDGGMGNAQKLLDSPEKLEMMADFFWAAEVVEPQNLTPDMAVAIKQYSKGGYSKGESTAEALAARQAAITTFLADETAQNNLKEGLIAFLGKAPTSENLMTAFQAMFG